MNRATANTIWGGLIVDELVRCGVSCFCISPGSRSTPLALAAARNEQVEVAMHFDERGSAFRALGYSKATGKPAAVVCTSGTAVANLFPAVVEAHQSGTPMILITADRPAELRGTGAMQTIDQVKIFGNYVNWFYDLHAPDESFPDGFVRSVVDEAHRRAASLPRGPVHLNCQFREPLFDASNQGGPEENAFPFTSHVSKNPVPSPEEIAAVIAVAKTARRGLILAGELPPRNQNAEFLELAEMWQWPIIADVCSGMRSLARRSKNLICHADVFLRSMELQDEILPDVVIQFGNTAISKSVMKYVNSASSHLIVISDLPGRIDPEHRVSLRIDGDPSQVARSLSSVSSIPDSKLLERLTELDHWTSTAIEDFGNDLLAENSELLVASEIFSAGATPHGIFLATSLPVREADAMARPADSQLFVSSNRGANGIDGTIASAIGFSHGLDLPVTLLIGDLAALHDLNSLSMLSSSRHPITIVILNNNGGGIFSFLPISESKAYFEDYFATPHGVNFRNIAEMFGIKYHSPRTTKDFVTIFRHSLKSKKSTIIEVATERNENRRQHQKLSQIVREKCEKKHAKQVAKK